MSTDTASTGSPRWLRQLGSIACIVAAANCASSSGSDPLIDILFATVDSDLSATDKRDIAAEIGLKLSKDGQTVVDVTCGQNANPTIRIDDLNADGSPEIIVQAGNACSSGFTGSSLWLFVRDPSGRLRANFGFPAFGYQLVNAGDTGFPDLELGGPGFCHPIWRWDGARYVYLRQSEEQPGGCGPSGP